MLVQNPDDAAALVALGIPQKRIVLIPGFRGGCRGVEAAAGAAGMPTIGFVGRLLEDKGIRTLIEAHLLLRLNGVQVQLRIAGTPDPANPASVTQEEADGWVHEPGIAWAGHVEDISAFWADAHVAALPSRREGLPKSLLEAAACGRPLIASDVPGCREIVQHGETGLLVPVDNARALADAIQRLITSPAERARYGAAARNLVVEQFAAGSIGRMTVELYRRLVSARDRANTRTRPSTAGRTSPRPRPHDPTARAGSATRSPKRSPPPGPTDAPAGREQVREHLSREQPRPMPGQEREHTAFRQQMPRDRLNISNSRCRSASPCIPTRFQVPNINTRRRADCSADS